MSKSLEPAEIKSLRFERNGGYLFAVLGPYIYDYWYGPFDNLPLIYVISFSAGLIHGKLCEIRSDAIYRDFRNSLNS